MLDVWKNVDMWFKVKTESSIREIVQNLKFWCFSLDWWMKIENEPKTHIQLDCESLHKNEALDEDNGEL